jgi:hypothetical protein
VLVVQKLDDRLPGIAVVDIVTKSRGIDNSQANYTAQFLLASRQLGPGPFNMNL